MKRCCATLAVVGLVSTVLFTPASALDLNSFRAQHGRPALAVSAQLAVAAYPHAADLVRYFCSVIPGCGR